jgi:hypothetical protein
MPPTGRLRAAFELEGELHDEWIEAGGAHVLFGRKFSGAGVGNSG